MIELCSGLNDPELRLLAGQLETLVGSHARTRYPDTVCFPRIPNEVYDEQMAMDALQLARKIVEIIQGRIP